MGEGASHAQALVSVGNVSWPCVCWMDNKASCRSYAPLHEISDDNKKPDTDDGRATEWWWSDSPGLYVALFGEKFWTRWSPVVSPPQPILGFYAFLKPWKVWLCGAVGASSALGETGSQKSRVTIHEHFNCLVFETLEYHKYTDSYCGST